MVTESTQIIFDDPLLPEDITPAGQESDRTSRTDERRALSVFAIELSIPLDLQRFAAEDEGRTEEPTERRKREERERGNVPKSQDLPGALVLLGAAVVIFIFASFMTNRIFNVFHFYFERIATIGSTFGEEEVRLLLRDFFYHTGMIIFPVLLAALLFGVVGNVVQVGFLFTMRPLQFQMERIIPDMTRVLPVRRNFVNLLKVLVQIVVLGFIAYLIISEDLIPMLRSTGMELRGAVSLFGAVAFKLLIASGLFLLVAAIPDYFYQRFEYMENLKMSMSDVKRELKEDVGDPMLRQRQRERAMQMRQNRRMLDEVPKADVVITNPTHFAVALRYDPAAASAPVVVAKGQDSIALMIRRIAKENRVHIEENPPLARALYDQVEVGGEIPENFYRSIVLIFQKLERFRRAAR